MQFYHITTDNFNSIYKLYVYMFAQYHYKNVLSCAQKKWHLSRCHFLILIIYYFSYFLSNLASLFSKNAVIPSVLSLDANGAVNVSISSAEAAAISKL